MPRYDDQDVERRLREGRSQPDEEFVQSLAARVRRDRQAVSRRRLTLAFALSLALLVSLVAFGGVGAASSALHSSTATLRAAVGHTEKARGGTSTQSAAKKQYHEKVAICFPETHYTTTYKYVTLYKWVGHGKNRHLVSYTVKVRTRALVTIFKEKLVHTTEVPHLVSKGAVYPVPAGGCSSLGTGTR